MYIRIESKEIKEAIKDYIQKQGIDTRNNDISITLVSSKTGRAQSAEITLTPRSSNSTMAEEDSEDASEPDLRPFG
jgi:hypothetical protein